MASAKELAMLSAIQTAKTDVKDDFQRQYSEYLKHYQALYLNPYQKIQKKNQVYATTTSAYKSLNQAAEEIRQVRNANREETMPGISPHSYASLLEDTSKSMALVPATPVSAKLEIEPAIKPRAMAVMRLAVSRENGEFRIARRVRVVFGQRFVGNLPWEEATDWEVCKVLREHGLIREYGQDSRREGVDAEGNPYVDVCFHLTDEGRALIMQELASDPKWVLEQNRQLLGDAGLRVLQVLMQAGGKLNLTIPLDLMDADKRLQKLLSLGLVFLHDVQISHPNRAYLATMQLRQDGLDRVKACMEAGWVGFTLPPWEPNRLQKGTDHVLEMLRQVSDEVLDLEAPTAVVPMIASTRKGRGGFGMTARRYGHQISEHTAFRFKGRPKVQAIELWQGEASEDSEVPFREVVNGNPLPTGPTNITLGSQVTTVTGNVYVKSGLTTTNNVVVTFPTQRKSSTITYGAPITRI